MPVYMEETVDPDEDNLQILKNGVIEWNPHKIF